MGDELPDVDAQDENDPDVIAQHPPDPVADPKLFFQTGAHEGKWSEYDDRGVPLKNAKKKKPGKKEKDALEQEFLEAKKLHQMYLKDVEAWEQRQVDAEAVLERSDRVRWAFRQVGEDKHASMQLDGLEQCFVLMGWSELTRKEIALLKKKAKEVMGADEMMELKMLRLFAADCVPVVLMESRLGGDSIDDVNPEDMYSPRSWRKKLETDPPDGAKIKKSPKGGKSPRSSIASPRGKKSPRDEREGKVRRASTNTTAGVEGELEVSPRSKGKKKTATKKEGGGSSPRGGASPRGGKR